MKQNKGVFSILILSYNNKVLIILRIKVYFTSRFVIFNIITS